MGLAIKVNKASGTAVYINGTLQGDNRIDLENIQLPYAMYEGSIVVFNNELHLIGGGSGINKKNHYKWDGSAWTSVSTLPIIFESGSAVVFNNEIHILYDTYHYKWDGTEWTSVSTTPYSIKNSGVVVYGNAIHVLGSNYSTDATKHYKWDGTSWSSVSTLPSSVFKWGCAVVYDNKIYLMARDSSSNKFFYSWDGTNWSSFLGDIPFIFQNGAAVVHNNKIYILGSNYYATGDSSKASYWDGSAWSEIETLPIGLCGGCAFEYNNSIYYTGGACGMKTMVKYGTPIYTK